MTSSDLGRRLDITAAGVRALEASEAAGTIKVATLQRAADAVLAAIETQVGQTMALEDQSVQQLPSRRRARRDELIENGRLWQDIEP